LKKSVEKFVQVIEHISLDRHHYVRTPGSEASPGKHPPKNLL